MIVIPRGLSSACDQTAACNARSLPPLEKYTRATCFAVLDLNGRSVWELTILIAGVCTPSRVATFTPLYYRSYGASYTLLFSLIAEEDLSLMDAPIRHGG